MSDLPFTLDQLKILHAISIEGSFKKAAEKLYISQPAVSLQIQNLEIVAKFAFLQLDFMFKKKFMKIFVKNL